MTTHKNKRKSKKSYRNNRSKNLRNKKRLKKKKIYKCKLLKVCQWLLKPQGLLSLPLPPLKNPLLRQLHQKTFLIFLVVNRLHKQLTKMDSVLWTRTNPNKMDLDLWIRSQPSKILLLSWINQLTILIWISKIRLVGQVYSIIWTCRLNQLQLYLLATEEVTYSQDCLCQVNPRSNNNFNNNLNNLFSNNNNHQRKNHLYGMMISLANFSTSLAHLWTKQQVKINLQSLTFFQLCNQ